MLNGMLWLLQFVLALVFLAHGLLLLAPPAELIEQINTTIGPVLRLIIGVAEVLAAVGLTVPGLTRLLPWLLSAAAAGLIPVMTGATVFHIARGENGSAVTTFVLLVLVVFVAYVRWKVVPIAARPAAYRSA
jgi:hypothetical protein